MDPFTLIMLAVLVWGTAQGARSLRSRSARRAATGPARGRAAAIDSPEAVSRRPRERREPRTGRPATGRSPLDHPARAAQLGSRLAAALFAYPALAWMVPAATWRGWRFGRVRSRHWRRNGGDFDGAHRTATDEATARGWHIPGVKPAPASPAGPTAPADSTPDAGTTVTVDDIKVVTGPDTTAPSPDDDSIEDAEIVPEPDSPTPAEGTTPMSSSDLTHVDAGAIASLDGGDYETIDTMASLGEQTAQSLAEFAAEIAAQMQQYTAAVEAIHAEAASLNVDGETQGDLVAYYEVVAEVADAQAKLAELAEEMAERAAAVRVNLQLRHGAIKEAVEDSPVTHAADTEFYGKARV